MNRRSIAYGLAVVAVIALVWTWAARPDPIPPEILAPRVDSALVAERARTRALDSVRVANAARDDSINTANATRAARVSLLAYESETSARRARALADSARALGDTLSAAWAAAEAYRDRGDSLEVALVVSDSARQAEYARAEMWRMAYDTVATSRQQLLGISIELREAVDRANRRNQCRIVGAIPCPSRTAVAVVSAVAVGAGILYLDR